MEYEAAMTQLYPILGYVKQKAVEAKLSDQQQRHIELSVEEVVVNIIHYAYNTIQGKIWIECYVQEGYFCVQIEDEGVSFDPTAITKKNIENVSLEEKKIGGLGIFLTSQLVDRVEYVRTQKRNSILLKIVV